MPVPISDALASGRERATDVDDLEVVSRVLDGDAELFPVLMRRYNQRLYRVARSVLGNDAEAEDVLQEAYMKAFTHLAQFEGRASFATWLTRIALYEALRRRRAQSRSVQLDAVADDLEAPVPNPERNAANGELRRLLETSIDALPPAFRTVLVLRDVEGLRTAEVADALEIPEQTVKTRLFRARRSLRVSLAELIGEDARRLFEFGDARCDRLVDRMAAWIRRCAAVSASH